MNLAYPMQLSGRLGTLLLVLLIWGNLPLCLGDGKADTKFELKNDNGYRLGNSFQAQAWGPIKFSQKWSLATSLKYIKHLKIKGQYDALNPMMIPLFNAANSGGNQLNLGFSTNFYFPKGALKNFRLGASCEVLFFQDINGVQMTSKNL